MEAAILEDREVSRTYVMRGDFQKKELETYHLILAPSYACNMKCAHCYLPNHAAETLPEERVLSLIDEWSEVVMNERGRFGGIFHLKGGEPLILPYLESVLEKMTKLRTLRFMMTTNGISYSEKTIGQLVKLNDAVEGNVQIIVSLDGSTEEINSVLRRPGNFAKTVSFINRLNSIGITFLLNNVVHKGNVDDVPDFMEFARHRGAAQVNFLSFVPKGYGAQLSSYRPDPVEVFHRIHSVWEGGSDKTRAMLAGSFSDILYEEACGRCTASECVGGYRGLLYIVPNGNVYSCPNLNFPQLKVGNMMQTAVVELMDMTKGKVYEAIRTGRGEPRDRLRCDGERFLPRPLECLKTVFPAIEERVGENGTGREKTCCFSRNY